MLQNADHLIGRLNNPTIPGVLLFVCLGEEVCVLAYTSWAERNIPANLAVIHSVRMVPVSVTYQSVLVKGFWVV